MSNRSHAFYRDEEKNKINCFEELFEHKSMRMMPSFKSKE